MAEYSRILLVEDEPLIAMMIEDFLELLGRSVIGSVDTVAAALALIETDKIDAAILDVNLRGGEKSWPVADALAARDIPFILATGGSGDAIAESYRTRPVLEKPFTMDGVERALSAL